MGHAAVAILCAALLATPAELHLGRFSEGDLKGWEPQTFRRKDKTEYTIVTDGDRKVLRAHSRNSASGLILKTKVDLKEKPLLRWSWKVEHTLKHEDAASKKGEDFAGRVYALFPKRFSFFPRALVYVWSAKLPVGTFLRSPYSSDVVDVVVESGDEKAGQWRSEERNVREDYLKAFGKEPGELAGIGVMTDTDNTGDETTAWYGDIFLAPLTPQHQPNPSPAPSPRPSS